MCLGKLCGFSVRGAKTSAEASDCTGNDGSCAFATMKTTPDMVNSHPPDLAAVSARIESLLKPLRDANTDPNRQLSFLNVGSGVILAWVNHNGFSAVDLVNNPGEIDLRDAPDGEGAKV